MNQANPIVDVIHVLLNGNKVNEILDHVKVSELSDDVH